MKEYSCQMRGATRRGFPVIYEKPPGGRISALPHRCAGQAFDALTVELLAIPDKRTRKEERYKTGIGETEDRDR